MLGLSENNLIDARARVLFFGCNALQASVLQVNE